MQNYLIQLKNCLLWSNLSDAEIFDILLDMKNYFASAKEHKKSEKEIISDLGSPKEFARTIVQTDICPNHKPKMLLRKCYLAVSLIWLVFLVVYTFTKLVHKDVYKLSVLIPISVLFSLWCISGNYYLKAVISMQKIKIWCILQAAFFIFSFFTFYLMNIAANLYIQHLMQQNILYQFAAVYLTIERVTVILTVVVLAYSLFAFYYYGAFLYFGITCQSIGLLYDFIVYHNIVNYMSENLQIVFIPKSFIFCFAVSMVWYGIGFFQKKKDIQYSE